MSLSGLGDTGAAQPPPALFPAPEPTAGADTPSSGASGRRGGPTRPNRRAMIRRGGNLSSSARRRPNRRSPTWPACSPGRARCVRMGGTARVSVRVDAAWRVHVLVAELAPRGLAGELGADRGRATRRAYVVHPGPDAARGRLAARHGETPAGRVPPRPAGGCGSGSPRPGRRSRRTASCCGSGADDQECWEAIGAALAAAGLAGGRCSSPDEGGPAYRITGRRRLARLAELVGGPPRAPAAGRTRLAGPTRSRADELVR